MIAVLGLLLFACQYPRDFSNLNFENGQPGQAPPGYVTEDDYQATTQATYAKEGNFCAALERKRSASPSSSYGTLMQSVDAKRFRGKRLVFNSFVRTQPEIASNRAVLFVMVGRENGERALYNDNNGYYIRTEQWAEFELFADVCEDAASVHFGLMLEGYGKAYWDDIRVRVLDSPRAASEPPRPLEGRPLDNVVAFSRLLGYLRYFYPGDEAAIAKWELFAIDGVRVVEAAKDPETLAATLEQWSHPIAPAIRVFPSEKAAEVRAGFTLPKEEALGIVYWRHWGLGTQSNKQGYYQSERIHAFFDRKEPLDEGAPSPDQPFFAELGGGVSCLIPLALYEDLSGSLPRANKPPSLHPLARFDFFPSGNDRATRLANIALAWNVFQHFYPYFDVVHTDWLAALPGALKAAAVDHDELAFLKTLRRLVVQLRDGHGKVSFVGEPHPFVPPIAWDWVEEKLVITRVREPETDGVAAGDIVLAVDGLPAAKALAKMEDLVSSATPQWARWNALQLLLQGEFDTALVLQIRSQNGSERKVRLVRNIATGSQAEREIQSSKPDKTAVLKPGVLYVDLDRVTDDDFKDFLPSLEKATGIVFDLRGYPHLSWQYLQHLTDEPLVSYRWFVPKVMFPDRRDFTFVEIDDRWNFPPLKPRLHAKVVFVTDGRARSHAESILGVVRHHRLGEIVGSPTAGTTGDRNYFLLPGGYSVDWTGMKALKHDGSVHHGVGVLPTIPAAKTIRGVTEGRDELLEKAIEIASR